MTPTWIIKLGNYLTYKILKKRILLSNTYQITGTARRINQLLDFTVGENYLEIGTNYGFTFEGVKAHNKLGVDPEKKYFLNKSGRHVKDTSDNFFKFNKTKFDLIFIDGLHEYKQVVRDIINSLNTLNDIGILLIDDVYPHDFNVAAKPWEALSTQEKNGVSKGEFSWQGDVYKAIFLVSNELSSVLNFYTITDDKHIQTVIWKKNQETKFEVPSQDILDRYDNSKLIDQLKSGIPLIWNSRRFPDLLISLGKTTSKNE